MSFKTLKTENLKKKPFGYTRSYNINKNLLDIKKNETNQNKTHSCSDSPSVLTAVPEASASVHSYTDPVR